MTAFTLALAGFALLHLGVSATGLRARLVGAIGERPYRGLFSFASAGLLIWMIHAFGAMRADPFDPLNEALWWPPAYLRHVTQLFGFIGLLFAVLGVLTPGPTLAGFEGSLAKAEPARGILRVTRHPFMWGVAFWAAGHVLSNGERFAPMLFGALGLMALYGTRSIDRKGRARDPEAWAKFAAITSNLPFAAILQGRNRLAFGEIGWRWLAAILAFAALAWFHGPLFGAPAFAGPVFGATPP